MNSQVKDFWMQLDSADEEVKGDFSSSVTPGLAMSTCDASDDFLKALAA